MLRTTVTISPSTTARHPMFIAIEQIAKEAVRNAIARQKALGLSSYYTYNGRIIGRAANGRFIRMK